jgi:DNA-binding MarR family transcriptional regulator
MKDQEARVTFDYRTKIPYWINRLSFMLRAELQQRVEDAGHDLAAEEWALLMVLWSDGPLPMNRLATITLRDRTTVTRVVDRLVEKGLLLRSQDREDRRQVIVEVSDFGRSIEPSVVGAVVPLIAKAGENISREETENALSVLRRMAENLERPYHRQAGAADERSSNWTDAAPNDPK